ncbi:hypothetical protein BJV78DRAFT_1249070 [Lactifluus subvellereus]|nr:hypothetical protein BJV78DRAFT_1249070 [Lactifluus subvellereus]
MASNTRKSMTNPGLPPTCAHGQSHQSKEALATSASCPARTTAKPLYCTLTSTSTRRVLRLRGTKASPGMAFKEPGLDTTTGPRATLPSTGAMQQRLKAPSRRPSCFSEFSYIPTTLNNISHLTRRLLFSAGPTFYIAVVENQSDGGGIRTLTHTSASLSSSSPSWQPSCSASSPPVG